jgi:hypothetical protein
MDGTKASGTYERKFQDLANEGDPGGPLLNID